MAGDLGKGPSAWSSVTGRPAASSAFYTKFRLEGKTQPLINRSLEAAAGWVRCRSPPRAGAAGPDTSLLPPTLSPQKRAWIPLDSPPKPPYSKKSSGRVLCSDLGQIFFPFPPPMSPVAKGLRVGHSRPRTHRPLYAPSGRLLPPATPAWPKNARLHGGCKIKALRAKTNTYIKTPVRGEEPVFMVTGRREDVAMARREIISAAEHFSMIRASRNKAGTTFGSAPTLPGQVTIRVRVPYRVVGLVVGPKGATIKRIQQQTNTYIITPSRDRDPVFEITGAPGNVERAREEIETHIAVRTGKILEYNNENDFLSSSPDSGMENRYSEAWRVHTPAPGCKPLSTFRQNSLGCIGDCSVDPVYETPRLNDQNDFNYGYLFPNYGVNKQDLYYGVPESGAPMWAGQENTNPVSVLFSKQQRSSSTGAIHPNSHRSPSSSIQEPSLSGLPRRSQGEPLQGFSKLGTTAAARTSVSSSRECMVCFESEVTAALVPCGHNLFCMECAVRICERTDPECPVCHAAATQAIRIFS
uniref:Mex-3 RNA binding family member A n=1 Tax=Dromaius novaehollandiae TaxID=8790 RepID=A0A8C4K651_DRONO|nr:RNA-binding protein MEX3A isoform X1 [Dromaius novaehollandiae]